MAEQGFALEKPQRLSGGRTNHVWRAGSLILKLFNTLPANPLFANSAREEARVLQALSGSGLAPEFCAAGDFEGQNWLLYHHIDGDLWRDRPEQVAALLGQLHAQAVPSGLPQGANGSENLLAQTKAILGACSGAAPLMGRKPDGAVPPCDQLCLIHGDPVPGNIVVTPRGLVLIDWQCPQFGDPAEDLALFLSPAMQSLYGRRPLTIGEVQAFLATYPNRTVVARLQALQPWFHWRMASYCLWRGDRAAAQLELNALGMCRT